MLTAGRVAITVLAALLIGAYSYATVSDLDRNGDVGAIVFSPAVDFAVLALFVLVPAIVNRWWAISIAFVPIAVGWYLHEMTDYVYPFHEDPYPGLALTGTVMAVGLALAVFLIRRGIAQAAKDLRAPNRRS